MLKLNAAISIFLIKLHVACEDLRGKILTSDTFSPGDTTRHIGLCLNV